MLGVLLVWPLDPLGSLSPRGTSVQWKGISRPGVGISDAFVSVCL